MLSGSCGEADHKLGRLLTPHHAIGKLGDRESGSDNGAARFVRPVGQCDAVAEIGRHDLLAGLHLDHVVGCDAAFGHEHAANEIDRGGLICGGRSDDDRRLRKRFDRHATCPGSLEMSSPVDRLRTTWSDAVLLRKLRKVRTTAAGARCSPRTRRRG